MRLLAYYRLL